MSHHINRAARAHLLRITRRAVLRERLLRQVQLQVARNPAFAELLQRPRHWNRRGEPISYVDWCVELETGNRRVAETTLDNGLWVSTVWLGIDHGWGQGKPVIFETMVFAGSAGGTDLDQRRYTSELAARTGHLEMVQEWAAKEKPAEGWG